MKKELKEKIKLVANYNLNENGTIFVIEKLQEELIELLHEVNRCIKYNRVTKFRCNGFYISNDCLSEMADVENLIAQIGEITPSYSKDIEKMKLEKINRTIERYNIK